MRVAVQPATFLHNPQIADLIAAGKVKLEVALSLPLEEAAKAHDQVGWGREVERDERWDSVAMLLASRLGAWVRTRAALRRS
jgi:hypothetical protein